MSKRSRIPCTTRPAHCIRVIFSGPGPASFRFMLGDASSTIKSCRDARADGVTSTATGSYLINNTAPHAASAIPTHRAAGATRAHAAA